MNLLQAISQQCFMPVTPSCNTLYTSALCLEKPPQIVIDTSEKKA
jgi:hypothetical protein